MKRETCKACGSVFMRDPGRRMHKCPDCRLATWVGNTAQSHLREGAYYEKTVRGALAHWKREAERLGIDT